MGNFPPSDTSREQNITKWFLFTPDRNQTRQGLLGFDLGQNALIQQKCGKYIKNGEMKSGEKNSGQVGQHET